MYPQKNYHILQLVSLLVRYIYILINMYFCLSDHMLTRPSMVHVLYMLDKAELQSIGLLVQLHKIHWYDFGQTKLFVTFNSKNLFFIQTKIEFSKYM